MQSNKRHYSSTALARLEYNLPHKPYCSDNKTASLIRDDYIALRKKYIQVNQPTQIYWLVFDLDDHPVTGAPADPFCWQFENLPPPNFIVSNKHDTRSHLFYAIAPVCCSINARQKPLNFLKSVRNNLGSRLGADRGFTSPVCKNPFSSEFRTTEIHDYEYSLAELDVECDDQEAPLFQPSAEESELGRNSTTFDWLRVWAYENVYLARENGSYETWLNRCNSKCKKLAVKASSDLDMLPAREVKSIAKSVARWTWDKYTGEKINRGVMNLKGTDITTESKQRLSARRTHEIIKKRNSKAISSTIRSLQKKGCEITIARIAAIVKLSKKSLYTNYSDLFKKLTTSIKVESKGLTEPNTPSNTEKREGYEELPSNIIYILDT